MDKVTSVSLSGLQDGVTVVHVASEYDVGFLLENKTEFVTVMDEYKKANYRSGLQLNFSDNITYKIKSGDSRILTFQRDGSGAFPTIKKNAKTLHISVAPGLDKSTDTAPQGMSIGKAIAKPKAAGPKKVAAQSAPQGGNQGGGPKKGGGLKRPGPGAGPGPSAGAGDGGYQAPPQGGGVKKGGANIAAALGKKMPMPGFGAPKKAPKKPAHPQAKALYDYTGQTDEELSFHEGDLLSIHQKDPGGWWEGELNGRKGWVPANYLQEL